MTLNRIITSVIQITMLIVVIPMARAVWLDIKENLIPEIKHDLRQEINND